MSTTTAGVEFTDVSHDENLATHRFEFDPRTNPGSMAVVAALATVTETDPVDLAPLHATVDTDALDTLLGHRNAACDSLAVTFEMLGYVLTVRSAGAVEIEPTVDGAAEVGSDERRGQ